MANYDPYNIQYQDMPVSSWNSIPADQTEYSQYWSSPQAFEPEAFAQNITVETKWNDVGYMAAFLVNVCVTIGVMVWLWWKSDKDRDDRSILLEEDDDPVAGHILWTSLGIGFAIAVVLTILHFVYIFALPVFYVKFGMIVWVILSVVAAVVAMVTTDSYYFWIFPALSIFFVFCFYCMARKYLAISAAILKTSIRIIAGNCSLVFVSFLWAIIGEVIACAYSVMIYFNERSRFSNWFYFYICFSYIWVTLTFSYVSYMTGAGLAASWYFLNDTEYFPASPVWESFKRALTTSFGSACAAALFIAIIEALKTIVNMATNSDNDGAIGTVLCILRCMALCILNCLQAMIRYLNRYGLIYCATFGVPYAEGCRRWTELSCKKFSDVIMSGNIVGDVLASNLVIFTIAGAAMGYGFGYLADDDKYLMKILSCVFATLLTYMMFLLMTRPVGVVGDTLLICFSEEPENLKTSAHELAEELEECYHKFLGDKKK